MAFELAKSPEDPQYTLVSSYTVKRIGKYPSVTATYTECVHLLADPVLVLRSEDADGDGNYEVLDIPALADGDMAALVGRKLMLADNTLLGTIVDATLEEVDVGTEPGTSIVPVARIMVDGGGADLTGQSVALVEMMPVGTQAYRRSGEGKQWVISLDGERPEALARMMVMLAGAHFAAVKLTLAEIGLTEVTDAQIMAGIQALAQKGINIDGLLAQQGEALERDRRAGLLSFADVVQR